MHLINNKLPHTRKCGRDVQIRLHVQRVIEDRKVSFVQWQAIYKSLGDIVIQGVICMAH